MLISIFIPVYNGEKYIANTLNSVLSQTYSNIEVLLVDDSSTDNSFNIITSFAKEDSRIKAFRKENGGNVPSSWVFVLPKIQGRFIHYLSQDDTLDSDYIEKLYIHMQATDSDIAIGNCCFKYDGFYQSKLLPYFGAIDGVEAFKLSLNWTISGFGLYKTELYRNINIDTSIFNYDEYLTRLLFTKAQRVCLVDTNFYYYQGNPNAITKNFRLYRFQGLQTSMLVNNLVSTFGNLDNKIFWLGNMISEVWNLTVSSRKAGINLTNNEYSLVDHCLKEISKNKLLLFKINLRQKIKYLILETKYH